MTAQPTDLRGAFEAAERARDTASKAHAELHALEREAQRERERRTLAQWQGFLDAYDPAALRQSVVNAELQLRSALLKTDFGKALLGLLETIMREARVNALAQDALNAGAQLPAGLKEIGPTAHLDAEGKQLDAWADEWIAGALSRKVYAVAADRVAADETAVRDKPKAAWSSVDIPEPSWWKVVAPFVVDQSDLVGAVYTNFVGAPGGSVAYLQPDNPALRWYRDNPEFDVQAVYGVPGEHQKAVQRLAVNPDANKPVGSASREASAE